LDWSTSGLASRFWETNGAQPHWVNLSIPSGAHWGALELFTHPFANYTAKSVRVLVLPVRAEVADEDEEWIEVHHNVALPQEAGWLALVTAADAEAALAVANRCSGGKSLVSAAPTIEAWKLRVEVVENYGGGRNTRLAALRLTAAQPSTADANHSRNAAAAVAQVAAAAFEARQGSHIPWIADECSNDVEIEPWQRCVQPPLLASVVEEPSTVRLPGEKLFFSTATRAWVFGCLLRDDVAGLAVWATATADAAAAASAASQTAERLILPDAKITIACPVCTFENAAASVSGHGVCEVSSPS
jgi:hypothetical protein